MRKKFSRRFQNAKLEFGMCCQLFVLLEEGVCYDQWVLLAKLCQPLPCFILYSKAKFACFSRYLLPSYFAFQSSIMKRTFFFSFGVSSRRSCRSSQNRSTSASSLFTGWGLGLDHRDIEQFALEMNRDHSLIFEIAFKYCISDSFVDHDGYSISSKGFLPTVVDIMVI